ncbi:hypothetical protein Asppvi_001723 [Aspergillus pseudoviridinutans]|uniref:NmrA-like domain-containing protein n=1 Tax=Aspergillus pseudoviridinutans TaxID=1517512 RepID=A0A9P3B826_9EURO|nr:uncharacterized protein Asppvi_001723 [Aspergillus pseudoviridinutans]GIJ83204.1 hypothetical protein Asppvi_001723 [Aspergillus pseudoviridinutans]
MAITKTKVIAIGAGGLLGPHIVAALDADTRFAVSIFPNHLTVHRTADSYPAAELLRAFKGQDVVVSTITARDDSTQQQKAFIDTAVNAGVRRFVPSEFVPSRRNNKARKLLPQFVTPKLETVDYLRSKEQDGLEWTAFVTGMFIDP